MMKRHGSGQCAGDRGRAVGATGGHRRTGVHHRQTPPTLRWLPTGARLPFDRREPIGKWMSLPSGSSASDFRSPPEANPAVAADPGAEIQVALST